MKEKKLKRKLKQLDEEGLPPIPFDGVVCSCGTCKDAMDTAIRNAVTMFKADDCMIWQVTVHRMTEVIYGSIYAKIEGAPIPPVLMAKATVTRADSTLQANSDYIAEKVGEALSGLANVQVVKRA